MKIVFRVDASAKIGTGHVMRCLSLARQLRSLGHDCQFISKTHVGNLVQFISEAGFTVHPLVPNNDSWSKFIDDADGHSHWLGGSLKNDAKQTNAILEKIRPNWLIVDHYALDYKWEKIISNNTRFLMVIDDLADRRHHCDILLDQNWFNTETTSRYNSLVSPSCKLLLGPKYAMISPEYQEKRKLMPKTTGDIRTVLVFLGGSDKHCVTSKVLQALNKPDLEDLRLNIVLGNCYPDPDFILAIADTSPNVKVYPTQPSLLNLMIRSDIMIGGGGMTTWERMCIGLPSIVVSIAENQKQTNKCLAKAGYINYLGDYSTVGKQDITSIILNLQKFPLKLMEQSRKMKALVRGDGISLVCDHLLCHGA